jgi:hypothetical protein
VNEWTGANGETSVRSHAFPVPALPVGTLIARIDGGRPFAIGGGTTSVTMPASGRLLLGVNDDHHADNAGAFRVAIRRAVLRTPGSG